MHKHGGDVYSYPGFLDFSANINFLGAPKPVIQAAKDAMDHVGCYPQPGSGRLKDAIGRMEQTSPRQVICGNGAAEVIFSLVLAKKPGKALIPVPTFQEYEQALGTADCEVAFWPMEGSGALEFQNQVTEDVDLVFFCNPNNPTGRLYERRYVEQLLEKCAQAGALLVVDECFLDFVPGAPAYTMKPYLAEYQNLFLLKAFTKVFGIPGLRLGYGLSSNQELLEKMNRVTQPWNVSLPAQEAGIAAAGEQEFLEKTREAVAEEKQYLLEQLEQFKEKKKFPVEVLGHGANFIFLKSAVGLAQALLKEKILIRDCSNFRGLTEGYYRIAVRTRSENEALAAALLRLNQ